MVSLAVECLLRREQMRRTAPVSPEERARRKLAEKLEYRRLAAEAGVSGPRQATVKTPEEIAARQLAVAAEKRRLQVESGAVEGQARASVDAAEERHRLKWARWRNKRRGEQRHLIAKLHRELALLPFGSNERNLAISQARVAAVDVEQNFLANYCNHADDRILADDDPLVTLPPEQE
jgi:hypothetical protein